ncbi:MAG: hypothetical protein JNL73_16530, partial [Anaerolineales bacterium]|nr:hypothetical protein [Anaerolineales bacterium]
MTYRLTQWLGNGLIYAVLTFFAIVMVFPFLVMLSTSLKEPADSYSYPPRLLPREIHTVIVPGYDEPLPLYTVPTENGTRELALAGTGTRIGVYALPDDPATTFERSLRDVDPAGGALNQETITLDGV